MRCNVTYHPISEKEIQEWYFDVFVDNDKIDTLSEKYNIDEFNMGKYRFIIESGLCVDGRESFDDTHGFSIAKIQGFFRKYFYIRNSAFSFLIDEHKYFKTYTKGWRDILVQKIKSPMANKIKKNYSSGVYIPFEKVIELLEEYNKNNEVRSDLDKYYSENRINVFIKALEYANENKLGLLEATEVILPNLNDLNKSFTFTNFLNCDLDGLILYQKEMEGKKNINKK
jgi:hypothetical protein